MNAVVYFAGEPSLLQCPQGTNSDSVSASFVTRAPARTSEAVLWTSEADLWGVGEHDRENKTFTHHVSRPSLAMTGNCKAPF
jgi:hypothetical protein